MCPITCFTPPGPWLHNVHLISSLYNALNHNADFTTHVDSCCIIRYISPIYLHNLIQINPIVDIALTINVLPYELFMPYIRETKEMNSSTFLIGLVYAYLY